MEVCKISARAVIARHSMWQWLYCWTILVAIVVKIGLGQWLLGILGCNGCIARQSWWQ